MFDACLRVKSTKQGFSQLCVAVCAAAVAMNDEDEDGDMADLLKEIFLENQLSAKKVHKLAKRSFKRGLLECASLEKAGAHGKHPQNLARDMMKQCLKRSDFPCGPYWAKVPVKNKRTKATEEVLLPFLLLIRRAEKNCMLLKALK